MGVLERLIVLISGKVLVSHFLNENKSFEMSSNEIFPHSCIGIIVFYLIFEVLESFHWN